MTRGIAQDIQGGHETLGEWVGSWLASQLAAHAAQAVELLARQAELRAQLADVALRVGRVRPQLRRRVRRRRFDCELQLAHLQTRRRRGGEAARR